MRLYPEAVIGLLRAAWNAPRAVPRPPRRVWRDWALLGAITVSAFLEGLLRTDVTQPVVSVLAVLISAPTVLWRRTRPLLMLILAMIVTAPLQFGLLGTELHTSVFAIVLVYALFRWASGREIVLGSALLIVGFIPSFIRSPHFDDLVGGIAVLLAAAALGLNLRARAGARLRRLQRVRLLEREHLARDLHDTVAHHISAIAIRSQAGLAMASRDPAAASDALRLIEAEAVTTLNELRAMVRVLRDDASAELAPSLQLGDIRQLAGTRPGGVVIAVRIEGDDVGMPPPVSAAVFRLAQESVTNALRHARQPTRVDVLVRVDDDGVRLQVTDDGGAVATPVPGFGIIGMRERAALLGGTCDAGPAAGGGWSVRVELPRRGWAL